MFENKLIGIDIGSYYTKIISGSRNGKKIVLDKEILLPTPEESYVDGYLQDPKMIAGFLNEVLVKNKITKGNVVFTVESSEIIMREMVMPFASETDLRNMLPFEIEKNFPVKGLNYISEYQVLEEFEAEGTKKLRLQVAIMPGAMVDQYWNLANELKLKPLALEIQPASAAKIISDKITGQKENGTVVLIDGGHSKTRFTVVNEGKIEFSRVFLRGNKELDETLANTLDVSKADARQIKMKANLLENDDSEGQDLIIKRTVQNKVDEWLMEIQPNLRYYLGLKEGNKIDKIFIYGGLAGLNGIAEYMQDVFNRPVEVFSTLEFLEHRKDDAVVDNNLLINAVGSIIQD